LKIGGLGLSTLTKDEEQESKEQQPVKKPKIPMLNVGGLGLSTVVPDPPLKQQEQQQEVVDADQP